MTEYKPRMPTRCSSRWDRPQNIGAGIDYLREPRSATVGSIHLIVIRPFPEAAVVTAPAKGISWVSADMIRDAQLHRRRDAQGSGQKL